MTQRYSPNESLERIAKALAGDANPTNLEGYLGQQPPNESLAKIAELVENSGLFYPSGLDYYDEFGGIYTWTGTVTMTDIPAAWTKITGSFQNSMVVSDHGVTAQPTQDRLLLSDVGTWFIQWSASFIGDPNVEYKIEPYCFVGMPQAAAVTRPTASGTVVSMSGGGLVYASGTAVQVALYLLPDTASTWFKLVCGQISARRVGKG